MKFSLYAIYDLKAGVYLSPFPARSEVEVIRNLLASRDDPQMAATPVCQHPEDFALFEVGSFDDESGHLIGDMNRHIISMEHLFHDRRSSTVPS